MYEREKGEVKKKEWQMLIFKIYSATCASNDGDGS